MTERPPKRDRRKRPARRQPIEHDLLLCALPHPILVLGDDEPHRLRQRRRRIVLSVEHRRSEAPDARRIVGVRLPAARPCRSGAPHRRDRQRVRRRDRDRRSSRCPSSSTCYGGPLPEQPGIILLMLQQRTMAQMIERQLTHRAAARSVSGMAAVLAHEIKNPLSGIRGAAQLLEPACRDEDRALTQLICAETDRIRNLVDRMEVFGDERPLAKEPVNIHDVLDHVRRLAETGFARGIRFVEDYDPSLPPVPGNRDKLVQAFLNLVKNAAEAIGESRDQRPHRPHDRVPARRAPVGAGLRRARQPAADDRDRGQRPRRPRASQAASVRSVRHHQAHRHRSRPRARRQDHRRPRRHHRVRQRAQAHRVPRPAADAGTTSAAADQHHERG